MTTLISQEYVPLAIAALDLNDLLSVLTPYTTGLYLFQIHILQQSSQQAIFAWHRDTGRISMHIRLSVVVNLLSTKTSMQIFGKPEFQYQQGTCAIFPSDVIHRSGHADDGTVKIALFFACRETQDASAESQLPCVCGNPSSLGAMVQCDLCDRWCHMHCTGLTTYEAELKAYTCMACSQTERLCICLTMKHMFDPEFDGQWVQCDNCDRWCHKDCTKFDGELTFECGMCHV